MGAQDKHQAPAPQSAAQAEEAYWLCQGRASIARVDSRGTAIPGKYRGLLSVDPATGDGVSLYWSKTQIEVALPESTLRECQADPEIVIVPIRKITKAEAEQHVNGPVVAGELAKVEALSTEALEAEIARRKAASAIAARNGKGN